MLYAGYANANMNAHVHAAREVAALFLLLLRGAINYFAHCAIFQLVLVALFKLYSTVAHTHTDTHTQWTHTSATLAEICK